MKIRLKTYICEISNIITVDFVFPVNKIDRDNLEKIVS